MMIEVRTSRVLDKQIKNKTINLENRDSKTRSVKGTKSRKRKDAPILIKTDINPDMYLFNKSVFTTESIASIILI